ncbi:hypothetical protein [Streptacidiphilus neutrinimicus]|uniref:hypothetical protein n=1 Tax=Streptacidiphilus neutrinimicus TaxID=105420 RepID=UPI0005AA319C|nr:hypothetical protein [Streptacidiphilus neutrinimicus]
MVLLIAVLLLAVVLAGAGFARHPGGRRGDGNEYAERSGSKELRQGELVQAFTTSYLHTA